MNQLELNPNWKFKDVKENIEAIASQFNGLLLPFFAFQVKDRILIIHKIKKQIFNFQNITYWQRERLWEVLNGDFKIDDFKKLK